MTDAAGTPNPVCIERGYTDGKKSGFMRYVWCVGCDTLHGMNETWDFNRDFSKPTFTPSIKVTGGSIGVCHSFLTDGVFHYLEDCTHALAGKTADLVPLPDWMFHE